MPDIQHGGFDLHYQTLGPASGPPLVLVAGSGEQIGSVEYPDEQCDLFADRGFRVIRMDNRDAGLSVPIEVIPEVDVRAALAHGAAFSPVPYTRMDMADDVIAVLNDLGVERAHLVGASMGGFIVRWAAVRHPARVASLTVIMSGAGAGPDEHGPQWERAVLDRLLVLADRREREVAIDNAVDLWRWLWGSGYPFEEEFVRTRVAHAYDRAYRPEGFARQALSSVRSPGLWEAQTRIRCPTLVLHGGADPCFAADHGRAIQSRIEGAELWLDPDMGHIMHREQWEALADRVGALAAIAT